MSLYDTLDIDPSLLPEAIGDTLRLSLPADRWQFKDLDSSLFAAHDARRADAHERIRCFLAERVQPAILRQVLAMAATDQTSSTASIGRRRRSAPDPLQQMAHWLPPEPAVNDRG
jgi:hypothetical protein